jgi:hypothetical protein
MRLEEDNCNNVPKRKKFHAEGRREYLETHKDLSALYMRNYIKSKAQKRKTSQASTLTVPTPAPIIYNYNHANEYFQRNFIGSPFRYACDLYDRFR